MLERFYPWGYARSVFAIDYGKLYERGFRGLVFDVDNTLVHHGDPSTPEVDDLFRRVQALGFKTVLLSDNDAERLKGFTANIDAPFVADAGKPDPRGYEEALRLLGVPKHEAVVIGDQVFTDIRGANAAGLASILVHFIQVPGEARIGKKRYVEKALLAVWRRSKRWSRRLEGVEIR